MRINKSTDDKHKHKLTQVTKPVPLYKYELSPVGGYTQGGTVATDIIKGFVCQCGYAIATDLQRKLA